jgi:hypothetical protein
MKFVSFAKANKILAARILLTQEQWQYVHTSLLWLQSSDYKFDETCEDLAFEFLQVHPEQFMPYLCGKFLGAIQKPIVCSLCESVTQKNTEAKP